MALKERGIDPLLTKLNHMTLKGTANIKINKRSRGA